MRRERHVLNEWTAIMMADCPALNSAVRRRPSTGKRTVALTRVLLSENPDLYMSIRIASGMQARKIAQETFPWMKTPIEFVS